MLPEGQTSITHSGVTIPKWAQQHFSKTGRTVTVSAMYDPDDQRILIWPNETGNTRTVWRARGSMIVPLSKVEGAGKIRKELQRKRYIAGWDAARAIFIINVNHPIGETSRAGHGRGNRLPHVA